MNEFTLLDFSEHANNQKPNNERLTQFTNSDDQPEVKPPDSIVQNVLNYSKALSVRKSEKLGYVDNILN